MNKSAYAFFPIFFIVNPFFFTISIFLLALIVNDRRSIVNSLAFVSATIYACLIQSQRIWGYDLPSDWNSYVYEGVFLEAGTTGFIEYVFFQKEPVWNFLRYIGYYLFDGSAFYFFNSIAVITIIIFLTSIYIFWKKSGTNSSALIASLVFVVFFVEFYSNLNNLLRQFFALSIVVYAYATSSDHKRLSIVLLVFASFIHTISFVFLFLFLLKPLYARLNLKRVIQVFIVFVFIFVFLSNASVFQNLPLLGYAFSRIATAATPHFYDDIIDPTVILVNGSVVAFFSLLMFFANKNLSKDMIFFANILLILMLVSILISIIAPMLMTRLYISRFFFFPFVMPYVLYYSNFEFFKRLKYLYTLFIVLFFIYWFVSRFDLIRGGGFFPPFEQLIMYSLIDFII